MVPLGLKNTTEGSAAVLPVSAREVVPRRGAEERRRQACSPSPRQSASRMAFILVSMSTARAIRYQP
jgi:hypothetical protein